jgi:hypothetical protein
MVTRSVAAGPPCCPRMQTASSLIEDLDGAFWRQASARWPVPHVWHDLNLLDHVAVSRSQEAACPADERPS